MKHALRDSFSALFARVGRFGIEALAKLVDSFAGFALVFVCGHWNLARRRNCAMSIT